MHCKTRNGVIMAGDSCIYESVEYLRVFVLPSEYDVQAISSISQSICSARDFQDYFLDSETPKDRSLFIHEYNDASFKYDHIYTRFTMSARIATATARDRY